MDRITTHEEDDPFKKINRLIRIPQLRNAFRRPLFHVPDPHIHHARKGWAIQGGF